MCSSLSAGMPRPWSRTSIRASPSSRLRRVEVDLAAGRGELDGVRDEVVEGLQDAVGIGPDVDAVGGEEDADVGARRAGLLHAGGAAQQVFGAAHGRVQLGLAARDALEVEDVVDQADEAVGVADGDLEHLLRLLGPIRQRAAGKQAERSAQRGERRAQLVGDGGDELVLHAVERAAFGGVGEGDDDAERLAGHRTRTTANRSADGRRIRRGSWCHPCARRSRSTTRTVSRLVRLLRMGESSRRRGCRRRGCGG